MGKQLLTLGWFVTIQCSQTFTRCSKQNWFVTLFFGHLQRPILKEVFYSSDVRWYELGLKQMICNRCHLILNHWNYCTSTSVVMSQLFRHVLLSKLHQFQYRIIFGLPQIERFVRISFTVKILSPITGDLIKIVLILRSQYSQFASQLHEPFQLWGWFS